MKNDSEKWFVWPAKGKQKKKPAYEDTYADYPGIGKVYDADVGKYAYKHLRLRDRFDPKKVAYAILTSQTIAFGVVGNDELPKKKNWKFIRDF